AFLADETIGRIEIGSSYGSLSLPQTRRPAPDWRPTCRPPLAGRRPRLSRHLPRPMVAAIAQLFRPGVHGLGRLYGPGQLGHRLGRRCTLWVQPDMGHPHLEFNGDFAPDALGAPGYRHRARSGASVSRSLSTAD